MAEKISTLILKVDLGCCPCYKKIRKILCKLQDKERIRTISYDDGNHTIAVAGPFDPHKLSCKIRCKGGKVIKGVDILQHNGGGESPAMNNGKNNHKGKTKEPPRSSPVHEPPTPPPVAEKPPSPVQPAPPDSHVSPVMEATIEQKKPGENPVELELPLGSSFPAPAEPVVEKARPVSPVDVKPPTVEIPSWPAPPQPMAMGHCGCSCCKPCYQGYYEGCRCCSCGRVYGYAVSVVPTPAVAGCYAGAGGGYSYRSACQLFSEEDPTSACTVM
ncbi:unnamed protein product [Triticum turgidum subsp. durum]|uniref:Uncharacterized protein n=1 Tax=Triticum turgidum subsp. durum TaxID=4567 RepID=A0A9R1RFI8_TRITD|nr:unnamed protein product [Triticum turgidum subsp. durum]